MLEKNDITIGDVRRYRSLAVAPIYARRNFIDKDSFMERVIMLNDAMRKTGTFSIRGVSVNQLLVKNDLENKVLIVGGMTLEGAGLQKRYSKFPFLIRPHSHVYLPVNCAEEKEPHTGGHYGMNTTIVMPSLRAGDVEQHDAWRDIMNTTTFLGRMNPTRSYCYADRHANVEDYIEAIGAKPRDGQVGIVAGIKDGERTIFYTDFFGHHALLEDVYSKLAKSFGIVARVHEGDAEDIGKDNLVSFLRNMETMRGGKRNDYEGEGDLYLIQNPVVGTALAYENDPVQVTMRQKVE
ncbi:hypothetical protein KY342_06445 [Candidatus Woesearchaeota archaeon]|nr:hypothetical protein [Candidatus Woesearchaeota archaeon]